MADKGDSYRSVWRYLMTLPFKQDYVDAGGIRTRYIHAGKPDAPTVLMLHGTGGHWEAFCANIVPLAEHFNVYAIDFLGCGFSDKPDHPYEILGYVDQVIGFMDAMGIERASLIGVSLGAWVAARAAQAHPDRVERIVLVSPSGLMPLPANLGRAIDSRRESANDASWDKVSEVLSYTCYDKEAMIDDIVAVRQQVYKLPGIEKIMPHMLTMMDPDIRLRNNLSEDQWRSIQAPVLIIAHVDSPDTFLTTGRTIEQLLPNAELLEMQRTAHWSQFEDPETFNPAAIRFLSSDKAVA